MGFWAKSDWEVLQQIRVAAWQWQYWPTLFKNMGFLPRKCIQHFHIKQTCAHGCSSDLDEYWPVGDQYNPNPSKWDVDHQTHRFHQGTGIFVDFTQDWNIISGLDGSNNLYQCKYVFAKKYCSPTTNCCKLSFEARFWEGWSRVLGWSWASLYVAVASHVFGSFTLQ